MKAIYAVEGWRGRPAGAWDRCTVVTPVDGTGPTAVLVWSDRAADAVDLFGRDAPRWVVDERPQWGADVVPGLTRLVWVRRQHGLTRDAFAAHWSERHTPLARAHHPGLRRYTQNVVVDGPPGDDVDGVAELGFDSADDMRHRMYDSEDGRRIIAEDVARFLDVSGGWRVLGVESRFSNGVH